MNSTEVKFKVVIPSYNNESWVEYNLASILNQTYTNYEVLYINDASIDNTLSKVNDIVGNLNNWKIISNKVNRRRGYNVSPYNPDIINFINNDDDVLVFVDGDDWLFDENVFYKLSNFYSEKNIWMTYGGLICYPSETPGYPQNTKYANEVCDKNLFRLDHWRASHLRTFKWGLYKKIKLESMIYSKTNDYYFHAEDLATSFPCLEMCPENKIGVLDFYSYVFNETPSNRQRGIIRENEAGNELELEIRNQIPYSKIKSIYE
jgi:glycosyltransferase involved in cell wall biosynthesis